MNRKLRAVKWTEDRVYRIPRNLARLAMIVQDKDK
jgi:hypothetical protein